MRFLPFRGRFRVAHLVSGWLRAGTSPQKLACSLALGFVLGVFPVFGVPTILCGVAAAVWRLNLVALQLTNYLAYPLQIALVWPFIRLANLLFGAVQASHGLWNVTGLSLVVLHITAAWLLFAVPAGLIAYVVLHRLLRWHRTAMV